MYVLPVLFALAHPLPAASRLCPGPVVHSFIPGKCKPMGYFCLLARRQVAVCNTALSCCWQVNCLSCPARTAAPQGRYSAPSPEPARCQGCVKTSGAGGQHTTALAHVARHRGKPAHPGDTSLLPHGCYQAHFHSTGTSHRSCFTNGETEAGAAKGGEHQVTGSST